MINYFLPGWAPVSRRPAQVMAMPRRQKTEDPCAGTSSLIRDYLRGRVTPETESMLLLDARHGVKASDEAGDGPAWTQAAVSYQVVLTKADKVKPAPTCEVGGSVRSTMAALASALRRYTRAC